MTDSSPRPLETHLYDGDGEVFPCVGEPLVIPGPAGRLEAMTSCPSESDVQAVAVICHPHPLYGGSMQNKVVHYMAKSLNELGLRALRFNFRGVGASEGSYGEAFGEVEDLRAVLNWVAKRLPGSEIWLAGFSFGAYVALREASRGHVARLITVAPPINFFDFSALQPPTCPWLLIQGDRDETVPAQEVMRWAHSLRVPPDMVRMRGADHFFHGQLNALRDVMVEHLGSAAMAIAV
jgi:alpha/beta superfamily hydrolase